MSFFDNLGKKITEVGQTAVQKTKEITDIAKFSTMIAEEEKKLKDLFSDIGKIYVNLHGDETEGELGQKISAVKASKMKIEEYNRTIKELKGYVRCENCGAEVQGNTSFCSSCGKPIPKAENKANENLVKCSSCGNMVENTMRFCTKCGNPMAAAQQAQQQNKCCPNCGKAVDTDAAFCTECGTKL